MPFDFGDIVLVRFPFTNLAASKQRPAAVVSSPVYNSKRPDVVIMAITSQFHLGEFGGLQISEWQSANLLKPSAIKPIFATIEQRLIVRQLGTLQEHDRSALQSLIGILLNSSYGWMSTR